MIFAGADGVLEAKVDRVKLQSAGDLFHVAFDGPIALGNTIATERASRRRIGVHHVRIKADVRRYAVFIITHV